MELRRAVPQDISGIMAIERECFTVPWSEAGMSAALEDMDAVFLVAANGEAVVGFAILHCSFDEGELYNIAVTEDRRGGGVGMALLTAALHEAEKLGVKRVFLEVRKSNLAARELYRKAGFAVCGDRRGYYDAPKEDAVLMDKEL